MLGGVWAWTYRPDNFGCSPHSWEGQPVCHLLSRVQNVSKVVHSSDGGTRLRVQWGREQKMKHLSTLKIRIFVFFLQHWRLLSKPKICRSSHWCSLDLAPRHPSRLGGGERVADCERRSEPTVATVLSFVPGKHALRNSHPFPIYPP